MKGSITDSKVTLSGHLPIPQDTIFQALISELLLCFISSKRLNPLDNLKKPQLPIILKICIQVATACKDLEMAMYELNQLKAVAAIMCENVNTPAFNHAQRFGQMGYFKLPHTYVLNK